MNHEIDFNELFAMVDPERMYQTILQMHEPRHYMQNPDGMDRAGDMLARLMTDAGLKVRRQRWQQKHSDYVFENIEGAIGDVENEPAGVMVAHFDGTDRSFAAGDNGAGVAIVLEAARILASLPSPPPMYVVAVNIEETYSNPDIRGRELLSGMRHNIFDEKLRCTTLLNYQIQRASFFISYSEVEGASAPHGDHGDGYKKAIRMLKDKLSPELEAYLEDLSGYYAGNNYGTSVGGRSRVGSEYWARQAAAEGKKIKYGICIDGGVSRNSRKMAGFNLSFEDTRPEFDKSGNLEHVFDHPSNTMWIFSTAGARKIGEAFCSGCAEEEVSMPYGLTVVDGEWDELLASRGFLASDHAGLLKHGIPSLGIFSLTIKYRVKGMLTHNFIHTYNDSIDKLDFDGMADYVKVFCKGILLEHLT